MSLIQKIQVRQTIILKEFLESLLYLEKKEMSPKDSIFFDFYNAYYLPFVEARGEIPMNHRALEKIFVASSLGSRLYLYNKDGIRQKLGKKMKWNIVERLIAEMGNYVATSGRIMMKIGKEKYFLTLLVEPIQELIKPRKQRSSEDNDNNK